MQKLLHGVPTIVIGISKLVDIQYELLILELYYHLVRNIKITYQF